MIKSVLILLIVLIGVSPAIGNTIDIYYPDNITTTKIYYSCGDDYNLTTSNNVSGDLQTVILKNDLLYEDVLESPHKIVSPVFRLVLVCVVISLFIVIVYLIKRAW